jgi:site-specific recombinase XerD
VLSSSVEQGKALFGFPEDWEDRVRSWEIFNEADGRLSRGSIDLYRTKLRQEFLPWLEDIGWTAPIENLTAEHLREYMNELSSRRLAGSTRLISRCAVRSLWRFLRLDDYVDADPFEQQGRIPRPKVEEHVVQILSPEDIERLLKTAARNPHLGARDVAIISVLADSGLRASELCALEVDDVDWREGLLLVRHGKGGKQRYVSLGRHSMRALDKYQRWRRDRMRNRSRWADPCDRLFITNAGSELKDEHLRTRLKTIAKRAGLNPSAVWPHKLRHTAATALADAGMSESELRALFGWSRDSGMVERYTGTTTALRAQRNHKAYSPLDRLRA